MRGSRLFALLPLLALSASCNDEGGGAFVAMETSWQLFCTGGVACNFTGHQQTEKVDFKVSCSRDSAGLSVTINAPADATAVPPSLRGEITISRLDPAINSCSVFVTDSQSAEGNPVKLSDACGGTGGCTVTGSTDVDGWDFAGTIQCDKLTQGTAVPTPHLLRAKGMGGPVDLKVDCG